MTDPPEVRSGGRPRRTGVSAAVLKATVDLVSRDGLVRTSLDEIAREAGVAKTTLYRRWPSKGALAIDALARELGEVPTVTVPNRQGLHKVVGWLAERVRDPGIDALLSGVVAEASHDPEARALLRSRIRDPFTESLEAQWGLPVEIVDRAFDIVVGTLLHRRAMNGEISDEDTDFVTSLVTGLVFADRQLPAT